MVKLTLPKRQIAWRTDELKRMAKGLLIGVQKLSLEFCCVFSSISKMVLMLSLPVSCLRRAALRLRIATLYVSWKQQRNTTSQAVARAAAIQSTCLQPRVSAMAPAMTGPVAPPMSGASMMTLIADPRCSELKMSPTMAGFRTFAATAKPVMALAAMKKLVLWLQAAKTVVQMNKMLAALKVR